MFGFEITAKINGFEIPWFQIDQFKIQIQIEIEVPKRNLKKLNDLLDL